jgi:hypothetical protein
MVERSILVKRQSEAIPQIVNIHSVSGLSGYAPLNTQSSRKYFLGYPPKAYEPIYPATYNCRK